MQIQNEMNSVMQNKPLDYFSQTREIFRPEYSSSERFAPLVLWGGE